MKHKHKETKVETSVIILSFSIILHLLVFFLNLNLGGHHCDELMLAMNAKSIANNLSDICGEHLPIYFDTWIVGGQSPLPTYLAALSIKLFGYSVLSYRLPMLIVSIAGLLAFSGLICELTENRAVRISSMVFCAFSPWHLFNSAWIIDCAFMAHFLIIGIYFLVLSLKGNRENLWVTLSMLFFSFTFYSYNSAILFIPVFLLVFYILLLKDRKINFWFALKSVLALAIFSFPFILYGLVNLGIINEMQFLGLNITKMEHFTRSSDLTLLTDLPWKEKILTKLGELIFYFGCLCFPDYPGSGAKLVNKFQYTNFIGGLFLLLGVVHLLLKKDDSQYQSRKIVIATLISIIFYFFSIYLFAYYSLYRYFIYNYILYIPMGYGFHVITKKLKPQHIKIVLCLFLIISLVFFGFQLTQYQQELCTETREFTYADGAFKCFDRINELGIVEFNIVESRNSFMVDYLYAYYQNDTRFYDFKDAMMYAYNITDFNVLTTDNSIKFIDLSKTDVLEDNCYIFITLYLDRYSIPDEYTLEQYGVYTLAYLTK